MEEAVYRLLAFMLGSALECADQPSPYGALRLLEAAQQLIDAAVEFEAVHNESLKAIAERIAQEKQTALTDRERFHTLLEESALALINCT